MPVLPSYRNQSNQFTGFYMRATLVLNGLIFWMGSKIFIKIVYQQWYKILSCRLCNLVKSCMNHETNYKGLFWILMKNDHTNLRVNKCWGKTYLTKLMKLVIPIFFFCKQKVKRNCVDVFKLLKYWENTEG